MSSIGTDNKVAHPPTDGRRTWQSQNAADPMLSAAYARLDSTGDTAEVGKSAEAAATAELRRLLTKARLERTGRVSAPPETNLGPVMPPQVELTEARRRGAIALANSIQALNLEDLGRIKVSGARTAEERKAALDSTEQRTAEKTAAGQPPAQLSLGRVLRGDIPTEGPEAELYAAAINNIMNMSEPEMRAAATRTAEGLRACGIDGATAETLIAVFMKLQMLDPNNSPETQNRLHEVMTALRKAEIGLQREKNLEAQEKMDEAMAKARNMEILSRVIMIAMVVVSVLLAAVTGGASLALLTVGAIAVGAAIGAATAKDGNRKDAALQGASWGAMAGALVPVAIGVMAVAQAAPQAARAAVAQLANRAATKAAAGQAKAAAELAAETAKAAAELAAETAKAAAKKTAEGATKETIEKAAAEAAAEAAKVAAKKAAVEAITKAGEAAGKKLSEDAVKTGAQQATQGFCRDGGLRQAYRFAVNESTNPKNSTATKQFYERFAQELQVHFRQQSASKGIVARLQNQFLAHGNREPVAKWFNIGLYFVVAGMGIGKEACDLQAARANIAAEEAQVDAKEHGRLAEEFQELIDEASAAMEQLVQAKNQSIDSVLKMMSALFGTRLKQYAAAMAGLR